MSVETVPVGGGPAGARSKTVLTVAGKYGTVIVFGLMVAVFAALEGDVFFTTSNLVGVLTDAAIISIVAGGLTVALIAGEFDLSIGYLASLAGVFCTGLMTKQGLDIVPAIAITLGICALVGVINGVIVTVLRVTSFVATLGVGTILVGFNYVYYATQSSETLPTGFLEISLTKWLGIPIPVYIAAVVGIILWLFINRTVVGMNTQAVGANPEAAHLAGVRVDRVRRYGLLISALCAGLGGILLAAQVGSGEPTSGDGYLLSGFAAAFLGSVAFRNSEFHILGTIIGVLTVGVAFNGLAIVGAQTFWQNVVQGGLLICAVGLSTVGRRLAER